MLSDLLAESVLSATQPKTPNPKTRRLVSGAGSNDHSRLASEIVGIPNSDGKSGEELK